MRPFIPAENPFAAEGATASREGDVIARIQSLPVAEVKRELARIERRLAHRHDNVAAVLDRRFHEVVPPDEDGGTLDPVRRRLIGAYFSEEYSFEAAALFNPSIVAHPEQKGVEPGELRFLMSLRAVGEGHVSSIIFQSGIIAKGGAITLDPPSERAVSPQIELVPGGTPDDPGLRLSFGDTDDLSAIVIFPFTWHRRHGLEDLRLTPFTDDDCQTVHLGTYTAVGGETIRQEVLRTTDFRTFELQALGGKYAPTKGMALFPRRLDGYYAMLGRQDHENIWLLRSSDLYHWESGAAIIRPRWPWEFIQIGNCGAPLEIDEGWLVLTHGVGAVRNYCIGACLLDRDDPSKLLARTRSPILTPSSRARNGYVPNVVYSCGGLVHGRTLILPYGIADTLTTFASLSIDELLATMA
nr:glycoside hydrolase family 130 protein [Stakelama marina]